MAILYNSPLGEIRGKVGNFLYRKINGKIHVSVCQEKRSKSDSSARRNSNDPAAINRKKRFALSAKLATCINSLPELKYFWKKITYNKMSSSNAILRRNFNYVTEDKILNTPYLIPDSHNLEYKGNVQFDNCEIILNYSKEILDFINDCSKERFIKVVGIIHSEIPKSTEVEPHYFKSVSSCNYPLSENEPINMSILLDTCTLSYLKAYTKSTLYFAFITSDEEFVPQNAAATFSNELCIFNK